MISDEDEPEGGADDHEKGDGDRRRRFEGAISNALKRAVEKAVETGMGRLAEGPEKIGHLIEVMKQHGISQMPVLAADGSAVGMIHEYDLLNGLIAGSYKLNDVIDALIAPLQGVVTMDTTIPQLRAVFAEDNVAVVRDGQKVVAIVTKIDLIEFLASR